MVESPPSYRHEDGNRGSNGYLNHRKHRSWVFNWILSPVYVHYLKSHTAPSVISRKCELGSLFKTMETGSCGTDYSGVGFQFGFGLGYPEVTCDLTISPGEAGTINLNVTNSGNRANFAFDATSSYPYVVFFANPQGCPLSAVGFCGFVDKNSTTSFQLTFLSTPGNYNPINVTQGVQLAILSSQQQQS